MCDYTGGGQRRERAGRAKKIGPARPDLPMPRRPPTLRLLRLKVTTDAIAPSAARSPVAACWQLSCRVAGKGQEPWPQNKPSERPRTGLGAQASRRRRLATAQRSAVLPVVSARCCLHPQRFDHCTVIHGSRTGRSRLADRMQLNLWDGRTAPCRTMPWLPLLPPLIHLMACASAAAALAARD